MNCEIDIPAAWKAAINKNTCPACGESIMTEEIKLISDKLNEAVQSLIELGEEKMDSILNTFGLTRMKVPSGPSGNDVLNTQLKIRDNPVQEFLARSTQPHLANQQPGPSQSLKALASQVNAAGDEYAEESMTPQEAAAFFQENANVPPPNQEDMSALSSILGQATDDDLPIPLQQDRLKRLQSSRNITSGTRSKNGFTRSG